MTQSTRSAMSTHPSDEALASWLERDPAEGEEIWEHIFACAACTKRAEELRSVTSALEEMGKVAHNVISSTMELSSLERQGTRLQHAHGENGREVAVSIGDVDVLAMHVPLGSTSEEAVHVELCRRDGHVFFAGTARPEAGKVILACHRSVARANPAMRVRVKARDAVLFDGTFVNA